MRIVNKPSVLVCVTGQYDCDRLIRAGHKKAMATGRELHVLCVHSPMNDLSLLSQEIEYLYRTAKELGADMTVSFNASAPAFAADFARRMNVRQVITGIPDERPNGFVLTLRELMPSLPITMVTKEGEELIYSIEYSHKALA